MIWFRHYPIWGIGKSLFLSYAHTQTLTLLLWNIVIMNGVWKQIYNMCAWNCENQIKGKSIRQTDSNAKTIYKNYLSLSESMRFFPYSIFLRSKMKMISLSKQKKAKRWRWKEAQRDKMKTNMKTFNTRWVYTYGQNGLENIWAMSITNANKNVIKNRKKEKRKWSKRKTDTAEMVLLWIVNLLHFIFSLFSNEKNTIK